MILEDNFQDIIKKASFGLKLSSEELAKLTNIPLKELEQLKIYKQPAPSQLKSLADILRLDQEKLSNLTFKKWHPKQQSCKDVIKIQQDFGSCKVNSYLLAKDNECLIIDSGGAQVIMAEIRKKALKPLAVLITHNHPDHVEGLDKLQSRYRCKIYQEKEDSTVSIGKFEIQILKTPGHHENHNCFFYKNYCFVGDLLFAGSIGNPNNVPYQTHLANIKKKILSLPESTLLFPGHGPVTSVKEELLNNPFF
ncbi:MAG TPA: MBL fold metallo-hydrolase [Candidatus Nanoarchaeia archaeon]|nr:MBL fold metallo-hydrolase [Candidatus Nanoarchaeia archaeon]